VLLMLLLLVPLSYAQLNWNITDLRCGNGKLDQFELCEKKMEEGFCDELGTLLKIDTACDDAHCTCVPRVNMAFCGNNRREGVEICDGTAEDKCPEYGQIINLSLTCNPKTCSCDLNETLPADYNPVVVEQLSNLSEQASSCGDKKVERAEECDPPDTLCTTNTQESGICTAKCKCLTPEMLAAEEAAAVNQTNETNVTTTNITTTNETVVNETVNETIATAQTNETVKEEKPGFFARIWQWIAGLFS